ncbi:hypothetical protein BG011_008678 [Mortierella polycephala]|uniref:Mitochondrial carrier n=1 Tax=Mortierella polycephala TaxID=41804 RepID=A0A9P6QDF2_9FUNG|nr:hypothetical protein BG011_008678 [Mortierella polycephala]
MSELKNKEIVPWHDFVAGSLGGMAQVIVGQPMDTIKTRLQIEGPTGRFSGPMDCLRKTINNEGFLGLYKGMASPLIGVAAVNALLFAAYSNFKKMQEPYPGGPLTLGQIAIAGAGGGIVNAMLASPVEMLKIRMQAQYGAGSTVRYSGPVDCARQLIRDHGVRHGLMRGYWITIVREIPGYAGFYAGFEGMKRYLTPSGENPATYPLGLFSLMASGATGGVSYWFACYPLDMLKSLASIFTKLQCNQLSLCFAQIQNQPNPPKGAFYIVDAAKQVYKEGGIKPFFRGFSPTIIRAVPAAAATFTTYELVMRALSGL